MAPPPQSRSLSFSGPAGSLGFASAPAALAYNIMISRAVDQPPVRLKSVPGKPLLSRRAFC